MANITGATNERVFQIKQWLGLNENPDGDTKLKMGEASVCTNFRVTRDGNLQKRPGTHRVFGNALGDEITGSWVGYVGGVKHVIVTSGSKAYDLYCDGWRNAPLEIGSFSNEPDHVHIFGFAGDAWFLTGTQYIHWDGTTFAAPTGYRPLVAISLTPTEGGDTLEQVNKLNGLRRVWISPDGSAATFQLPEKSLASVDYVLSLNTQQQVTGWTADTANGTVTFSTAPAQDANSYEIGYTVSTDFSATVKAMKYAEIYNGAQDTRVFLYGDGTNEAFYSGLDYDGNQRADYFPDMNEMKVGDDNTPITAMIRHYGNLVVYKTSSTYTVSYGTITLADSTVTAGFYITPVNRTIGCEAPGQAQLVLNFPRTLFGADVYEWRPSSSRTTALTNDERQAHRISDRVWSTLRDFTPSECKCFDDNYHQEYYIIFDDKALVHNYAADAWYFYEGIKMLHPFCVDDEMFFGTEDGHVMRLSEDYYGDDTGLYEEDGETIKIVNIACRWESGAMAFGQDYSRKYSAMLWLGLKPQSKSAIHVTVQTDRTSTMTDKLVSSDLATFAHANFGKWTFRVNGKPQMERLKIKAKKFVFYKLILLTDSDNTGCTVTSADIRVRFTGYTK